MSDHAATDSESELPSPVKPADAREFTLRGILIALLVAAVIGASYPYIVLKLGFGPNIAVVSAFFGYMALSIGPRRGGLRWESNLSQAAGMIAGQTAFLCTLLAAFDLLSQDKTSGVNIHLEFYQTFPWLTTAGILGVLLAVPLRQHFIVDEKLPYADGIAAAETLIVLDSRGAEARRAGWALLAGLLASAVVAYGYMRKYFEEEVLFRIHAFWKVAGVGVSFSILNLGSGMIIGLRICSNMLAGTLLAWVVAPVVLAHFGIIGSDATRRTILLWVMWPATGIMISGGLTALFLKWKTLTRTFSQLKGANVASGDFPMRWVVIGCTVSAVALVLVQYFLLGLPMWQTAIALILTIPLMLVGLRVLGETNWGPISALSNLMQGVFGVIAPGNIPANMIASGVTGSVVAESEGLIQSYKTGHLIGSTPKYLTYIQLMAVPIGAAATALMYPYLAKVYGIGGEHGLSSPISQKWAAFAKLLGQGVSSLHPSAFIALGIALVLGVVLTVLEQNSRIRRWVPSPTGIGIGMLIPGTVIATMFLGAWIDFFFRRRDPKGVDSWILPLASGMIAGEALVAVILTILIASGVMGAL